MNAFIFAAGLGTRLKPLTDTMPKALVPVGGKPLLAHVIEKLKAAGCKKIVINIHHFGEMIIDYVKSQNNFGVEILFSDEREMLLETGGAIKHAVDLLGDEPFLIHNVDIHTTHTVASKSNLFSIRTPYGTRIMGWVCGDLYSPSSVYRYGIYIPFVSKCYLCTIG